MVHSLVTREDGHTEPSGGVWCGDVCVMEVCCDGGVLCGDVCVCVCVCDGGVLWWRCIVLRWRCVVMEVCCDGGMFVVMEVCSL